MSSRKRDWRDEIGPNILAARVHHYETQAGAADALGCTAAALCHWETGSRIPSLESARRLAEEFGVSIDWLVGLPPPRERVKAARQSGRLNGGSAQRGHRSPG